MRDCPSCQAPVDGPKCNRCGHVEAGTAQAATRVTATSAMHRCSDERSGARCSKPGSLAESTLGGGPWYCAEHFPAFRNWHQAKAKATTLLPNRPKGALLGDLIERHQERQGMSES